MRQSLDSAMPMKATCKCGKLNTTNRLWVDCTYCGDRIRAMTPLEECPDGCMLVWDDERMPKEG